MKKLYFAAPLFNDCERSFNYFTASLLETHVDVFLPQRDGLLLKDLIAKGMNPDAAINTIYQMDIEVIRDCDILLAVLDGRTIDEGVAFELGFAKALGKICIGLKTDDRMMIPSGNNPMITGGCDQIYNHIEDIIDYIKELAQTSSSLPIGDLVEI